MSKDPNGFELQTTIPLSDASEKKKSIPADTPRVPDNEGSTKPTKSKLFPTKNGNTSSTVNLENGDPQNKAAEAQGNSYLSVNIDYLKSWQACLKLIKTLCLIAMVVSLGTALHGITSELPRLRKYKVIWDSLSSMRYGLAISVIGLILELLSFVFYLLGFNKIINKIFTLLPWVFTAVHAVMLLFTFVAPIALNDYKWTGPTITSFIAFDIIVVAGYTMDIYFNMVWLQGGPELACLPCF